MQRWHQQSGHDCSGKNGKVRWSFHLSLSLSHKSKRWESPLHSPLLPIHSFIHISIHCYLPSLPFQNRRENENGEMKRTTFQLSDWKPFPLFLNSYPPRGVRARSTTNHVERDGENGREGGRTAIFAPFRDVCLARSLLLARGIMQFKRMLDILYFLPVFS